MPAHAMPAYIVTTIDLPGTSDPYHVVVRDSSETLIADMSALSSDHADKVAESLDLLLQKLRPGRHIIRKP